MKLPLLISLGWLAFACPAEGAPLVCDLWKDSNSITHARAESEVGAYACLGFVHARDRAFQMDFLRKISQGRAAEYFGEKFVKADFMMRMLQLDRRAKEFFEKMSPRAREKLEAYTRGANHGFEAALKRGTYEFRDFGYRPEEWRPEHSLAVVLLQSFDQTRRSFEEELEEEKKRQAFGPDAGSLFTEDGVPWDTSILKKGEYLFAPPKGPASEPKSSERAKDGHGFVAGVPDLGLPVGQETGSNNWVVAPSQSASGHALLANDPHLALKRPSFWQWAHITGGDLDVIGASVPGVPVIVSGANRFAAWGLTNAYVDVADVYYVPEEKLRNVQSERPWVWVRYGWFRFPIFFKAIRRTAEGYPILPLPGPEKHALVLRWSVFDLSSADVESLLDLMNVRSAAEMDQTLAKVKIPAWNFVFADQKGGIGYRTVGLTPARDRSSAQYGVERVSELPNWKYLSVDEMPHVLNPARGYVVTANNRHWPSNSAVSSGRATIRGFRAFRIEELLTAIPKHDFASFARIQCDDEAVDARFLLPKLIRAVEERERDARSSGQRILQKWDRSLNLLRNWNYKTELQCEACSIYRYWLVNLYDEMGLDEASLYRILNTGPNEAMKDTIYRTFSKGVYLARGNIPGQTLKWGEIHVAKFPHLAGEGYSPAVSWVPTPGDTRTVTPGTAKVLGRHLVHDAGASQRVIVELSDPVRMRMILAGSNEDLETPDLAASGTPWSRWARCEYDDVKFPLDWEKVPSAEVTRVLF